MGSRESSGVGFGVQHSAPEVPKALGQHSPSSSGRGEIEAGVQGELRGAEKPNSNPTDSTKHPRKPEIIPTAPATDTTGTPRVRLSTCPSCEPSGPPWGHPTPEMPKNKPRKTPRFWKQLMRGLGQAAPGERSRSRAGTESCS